MHKCKNCVCKSRQTERKVIVEAGYVYLVLSPELDRVKIGVTARDYKKRFKSIQSASPDLLILAGVIYSDDTRRLEQSLHSFFAEYWSHGEWFDCGLHIESVIKQLHDVKTLSYTHIPSNSSVTPRD
jgi:hypothetical protein